LQQVLSLRQLGFSLDEVRDCLDCARVVLVPLLMALPTKSLRVVSAWPRMVLL
jgi:hypothetical protein